MATSALMVCLPTPTNAQSLLDRCQASLQSKLDPLAQQVSYFGNGVKSNRRVIRIEQAIHPRATGVEPSGNFRLGDFLFEHRLLKLLSDLELNGRRAAILQNAILSQEVLEFRTQMPA